ncbi:MAG: hypothetical protein IJF47_06660 [Candidatus Methanomethylophilaceae archaeon]|nr:hypothetical protein [Candidatus Methanomethylophilaceae archaeon]
MATFLYPTYDSKDGDFMDCIRKKVKEEIDAGWIGPNRSCEYYPCHYDGQDCTFCYCPFYPCHDTRFGEMIKTKKLGDVWSCSPCLMIHDEDVCKFVSSKIKELGITEPDDPKLAALFDDAAEIYLKKQ